MGSTSTTYEGSQTSATRRGSGNEGNTDDGEHSGRGWFIIGAAGGLVVGLALGGYATYEYAENQGEHTAQNTAYDHGVRDGGNGCLKNLKLVEVQKIPIDQHTVISFTNLLSSPGVPHVAPDELQGVGYAPLAQSLAHGPRVVLYKVPVDAASPPPDKAATNKLTRQVNALATQAGLRLAGSDDIIAAATTVLGNKAYPEAPAEMDINMYACDPTGAQ